MGLFGTTKRTLVVDLAAVLKAKGSRGRAAPRQQLQVLRALSRLVQREKMNVTAVIIGKPLNKAPHNKVFDGIRVRYSSVEDKLEKELCAAMAQAGSQGVLISDNLALENKMNRSGKDTLRVSTFRKILEDGNDQPAPAANGATNRGNNRNRRDRGDRPDRNERNERPDRGPRPERKNDRPKNEQKKAPEKQKQRAPKQQSKQDEISQMIDLVD